MTVRHDRERTFVKLRLSRVSWFCYGRSPSMQHNLAKSNVSALLGTSALHIKCIDAQAYRAE
jgi:hypothetical protein